MSSTVSNPYSFNIVNNTSFTAPSIAPNLPSEDTPLVWDKYDNSYYYTIIPSGVKVLKCYYDRRGTIYIGVTPGKKYIYSCLETFTFDDEGREDSGKGIYNINSKVYWYDDPPVNFGGYEYHSQFLPTNEIVYSASINNHAIDVEDY